MQEDKNKDELTPEEELNAENEMELLRLNLEYGAESYIDDDAPPEVVSMFLQQIRSFEEKFKEGGEMSTVAEALKEVDIPDPETVQEHELEETIERLIDAYIEKGIMIDRPDHLPPRNYLEFLTWDLLDQPIMTERPKGFTAGYLYNEIYQDHPDFIVENAILEIEDILTLEYPYEAYNISLEYLSETGAIELEEAFERILAWREQFKEIDRISLNLEDSIEDNLDFHLSFEIVYKTTNQEGVEVEHKGLCLVQMVLEERCWRVKTLKMPGFKV